jgi:hypothetical protein
MRHSSSPQVANAKISPRRKAGSTRREGGGWVAPKLMTGSRDGPNRDEWTLGVMFINGALLNPES